MAFHGVWPQDTSEFHASDFPLLIPPVGSTLGPERGATFVSGRWGLARSNIRETVDKYSLTLATNTVQYMYLHAIFATTDLDSARLVFSQAPPEPFPLNECGLKETRPLVFPISNFSSASQKLLVRRNEGYIRIPTLQRSVKLEFRSSGTRTLISAALRTLCSPRSIDIPRRPRG